MRQLALAGVLFVAVATLLATAASPRGEAVPKPPGAGVCVPKTIRMEYFSSLGARLGEYDARFQEIAKVSPSDPYSYKCLWYAGAPRDEAFVVFIGFTPAGVPGRIAAGNCAGTRKDSYPFYSSRKRYLGVSGGNRKDFQNAVDGNEKILKGVLAAAEAAGVGVACPGSKPKPPPPSPSPPGPKPTPKGGLGIDYSMPDRFGQRSANGMIRYLEGGEYAPANWKVKLAITRRDGKKCTDGDQLAVTVDGKPLTPKRLTREAPCSATALFPEEGTYAVRVRLKTKKGATLVGERTVVVQDWVIVGLGDSNGSGEGTPDIPSANASVVRWQSQRCDRSANSYQAQTALRVEERDPRTSVTFIHLACSGASVLKGLIGGYEGIVSLKPDLRPQVDVMKTYASGREIDAVLISIGINDLGFAQLVTQCIRTQGCPSSPFPESNSKTTLDEVMRERLASLPVRFELLAEALRERGVPSSRIYLNEYFDSTHDEQLSFCNPLIGTPLGSFSRAEAKWAHDSILVPLNAAVSAAAKKHRWRFVSGAADAFGPHGYCAKKPWIVGLTESLANQANANGTLHANVIGNGAQAGFNVSKVRTDLYPNGRTRRPSR